MIFPIGDDNVVKWHKPIFSYLFLAVNCLIFLYQASLQLSTPWGFSMFVTTYGSIPWEILRGEDLWTLLSSMFLHGWWMHLIGNMMFLWVFGDNIEASIGNIKFLLFYIWWGVIASMAHVLFNIWSDIPSIGASWAIAAVLWAYLMMFPHSRIKMFMIYGMKTFYIPAWLFLWFWVFQQFFWVFDPWWKWIARRAHIGWFAFWAAAWYRWRKFARTKKLTA